MSDLELYRFEGSPNCERVEMALRFQGRKHRLVEIDRDGNRSEVVEVSGQHLVPVLLHDGKSVPDSSAILDYLDSLGGAPALFPREPQADATARILIGWFDRVWKRSMNRILQAYASPAPDAVTIDSELTNLDRLTGFVDAWLENRRFLATDERPSAADFAYFPFLKHSRKRYPPLYESWNRFATSIRGRRDAAHLESWIDRMAEWE